MISWTKLTILIINSIINIFCIFLLLGGKKYEGLIAPLEDKEFPLKTCYCMGLKWYEITKYSYTKKEDKRLRKEMNLLYGEKYMEYYLRMAHARRFSLSALCLALFGTIASLAQKKDILLTFFMGLIISGTVFYYYSTCNKEQIKKRTEEYMADFPGILSKLALLVNAGMNLREAWDQVAGSDNAPLYKQMKITTDEIKNGASEMNAYYLFGLRTVAAEIRKFSSMIIQGLEKGNKELAYSLADLSAEMWELRKQNVIKQGALASGKLMIPMIIMFVGILVMVLVPIFANLGL